jgi:hypothetical protein
VPITIDEILEKGKQRKQLLTLAEKQEISDQARGIGKQGQWNELVQELREDPELQEVFEDAQLIAKKSDAENFDIIHELIRETTEAATLEGTLPTALQRDKMLLVLN